MRPALRDVRRQLLHDDIRKAVKRQLNVLQSTYHMHMLSKDASFEIPRCACAGGNSDEIEAILRSRHSTLWGIPNSVLGALLYCTIPGLMAAGVALGWTGSFKR